MRYCSVNNRIAILKPNTFISLEALGPFEGNITAYPRLVDTEYGEMTYEAWAPSSPRGAGDCVYTAVSQV